MNLLIDIGNSRLKWAQYQNGKLLPGETLDTDLETLLQQFDMNWGKLARPERVVASNVAGNEIAELLNHWVEQHWQCRVEFLSAKKMAAGVVNGYRIPQQLGVDRWAAIVAAFRLTGSACMVIDYGTAMTLDIVDGVGRHQGGMILPGRTMMRKALESGTGQIAESSFDDAAISLGRSTDEAIAAAINRSAIALVESVRTRWEAEKGESLACIVTGGDARSLFDSQLSHCRNVPDLVLRGVMLLSGMESGDRES